jgi:hypothetical protein
MNAKHTTWLGDAHAIQAMCYAVHALGQQQMVPVLPAAAGLFCVSCYSPAASCCQIGRCHEEQGEARRLLCPEVAPGKQQHRWLPLQQHANRTAACLRPAACIL